MNRRQVLATALAATLALPAGAQAPFTLTVKVSELRNATGKVRVALHSSSRSYPSGWDDAVALVDVPAAEEGATVTLSVPAPGRYAVIVVHDEDGDGRMKKNFIGLPLEGFGASNNPTFLGPPRFSSAAIELREAATIGVRLVYL
jgi:uncharacterized protein (DUF2141 family)